MSRSWLKTQTCCRYFTWDKAHFPTPEKMQEGLAATGRKLVAIIDPHIKQDSNYYIYNEAKKLGHLVKNKEGNDYDGCAALAHACLHVEECTV